MNINNPAALAAYLGGDLSNALAASTPGGIERQEAQGQRDFVVGDILPRQLPHGVTQSQLEAIGFRFGSVVDDVFREGKLPAGWTKRPTDHSMWSELCDGNGRVRLLVFYKAAFYDRNAHMEMVRRYTINNYAKIDGADGAYGVTVLDTGKVVHHVGHWKEGDYGACDQLRAAAKAWLAERRPDHESPFAYWGDGE